MKSAFSRKHFLLFGFFCCLAGMVSAGSFKGLEYSTSTTIKPGVWNTKLDEAKDYANKHDLPLVVFWARSVCGFCTGLASNLSSPSVTKWMRDSGYVFVFGKDYGTDGQETYDFARYGGNWSSPIGNYFPYCRVYWKSKNINYGFCGREKNGKVANSASAYVMSASLFMSTVKSKTAVIPITVTSDTAGCKVSGGGKYRIGTKITLKASAMKGYVFSGWYEGSTLRTQKTSYSYTVGSSDATFVGKFIPKADDWAKVSFSMPSEITRGLAVSYPVTASGGSACSVSFSGLPSGLKYSSKQIMGTPKKSGFYTVTGKTKTASGKTATQKNALVVRGTGECKLEVASNDTTLGTVSGRIVALPGKSRTLTATPKKNRLFAGWYRDATHTTLLSRKKSWKTKVPDVDTVYYGRFVTKTADQNALLLKVDEQVAVTNSVITNVFWRGVKMALPVSSSAILSTSISASSLPAGLSLKKIATEQYVVSGTPTTAKTYVSTLKVKSSGGGTISRKVVFVIVPQPSWAVGSFDGIAAFDEKSGNGVGRATMTIAASGKTSGKFALGGTNWTFTATGYSLAETSKPRELDWAFTLNATAVYKKLKRQFTLVVKSGQVIDYMMCSDATGGSDDFDLDLVRNIWKDAGAFPARPSGTFALDPAYYPSNLNVTIPVNGTSAKFAGTLNDGKVVSCSSMLYYEPRYRTYCAFLIVPASKTYPGSLYDVDLGVGE